MKLAGKTSEKQNYRYQLARAYSEARSEKNFFDLLQKNGLLLYERGGVVSGIQGERRRYRLRTLGYSNSKIKELGERNSQRYKEILSLRNSKDIENEKNHKKEYRGLSK